MNRDDFYLFIKSLAGFALFLLITPVIWWVAPQWLAVVSLICCGMSAVLSACIAVIGITAQAEYEACRRAAPHHDKQADLFLDP